MSEIHSAAVLQAAFHKCFEGLHPLTAQWDGPPLVRVVASPPDGADRFLMTTGLSGHRMQGMPGLAVRDERVELAMVVDEGLLEDELRGAMTTLAELARFVVLKAPLQRGHTVPIGGPLFPGAEHEGFAVLDTRDTGLQGLEKLDLAHPPTVLVAVGVTAAELETARAQGLGAIYPALRERDFVSR